MREYIELNNKHILVLGLGVSGICTMKYLKNKGAIVTVLDFKKEEELQEQIELISNFDINLKLGLKEISLDNVELIIKSPGIPYDIELLKKADKKNIEVITDIELAFRNSKSEFIAITGTNGKTTITTLLGEIFKKEYKKTYVAGNIGLGILSLEKELEDKDSVFIVEASSFQLYNTKQFKPKVSLITNITPDHLNWHHNMEHYIESKSKIMINQSFGDVTVLNNDNENIIKNIKELNSDIVYFSYNKKLSKGAFLSGKKLVYFYDNKEEFSFPLDKVKILGKHNIENILASIAVSKAYGIENKYIYESIENFNGVEHRIEFVDNIENIKYYNDSKGTNTDASIKAVEALEYPITLIAGGIDKGESFEIFISKIKEKVVNLVLIGETSAKIKVEAQKQGIKNIFMCKNMNEAVKTSYENSRENYSVLLSPACASWDMYSSYEERGNDFKNNVYSLKE